MEELIRSNWSIIITLGGIVGSYCVIRHRVEEMVKDIARLEAQVQEHNEAFSRMTVLESKFDQMRHSQDVATTELRTLSNSVIELIVVVREIRNVK